MSLGFMSGFEILSEVWIWAIMEKQKMFPNMNSYSQGMKIIKFGLMRNRNHGGPEILSEVWKNWRCSLKNMIPTSLEEILVRFWRFPILQVGKRIHFLFSPLSFLATKSEEFIGKVSLSLYSEVVFLDYTFLDLLRSLGRLGMRYIYVLHGEPFSFVCSVHYHSLIFHLGALMICFYAHLAFISLDTVD